VKQWALLFPYMGNFTHLTGRLPPNVRNISPTFLSLETLRSDLLKNLNLFLYSIVMAHSLLHPLYLQQMSSRTSCSRRGLPDSV